MLFLDYPTLQILRELEIFWGMQDFIGGLFKDFSKVAKPMTQLLMKDAKFDFDNDCKKCF